jgi:hypothetical protein
MLGITPMVTSHAMKYASRKQVHAGTGLECGLTIDVVSPAMRLGVAVRSSIWAGKLGKP